MNALIFAALIWAVCKLISAASCGAKERAAERERERIRQEQTRIREEQARARQWQREQEQRAREAARRQVEHDKAIARAARERDALRKEQARQAAQLEKHEQELDRMRHVLAQATADIDFLQERSAELYAQLDNVLLLQAGTVPGSSQHTKYQSKIVTLHNQIHAAETKLSRAQYQREQANKKLSA